MDSYLKEEYKKRYESMVASDLGMTTKDFKNFDVINFDSNGVYHVELKSKTRVKCDCPDFVRRGYNMNVPCKHIMYVLDNYEDYTTRLDRICNEVLSKFYNSRKEN